MNVDVEFHIRNGYLWNKLPANVRQVRPAIIALMTPLAVALALGLALAVSVTHTQSQSVSVTVDTVSDSHTDSATVRDTDSLTVTLTDTDSVTLTDRVPKSTGPLQQDSTHSKYRASINHGRNMDETWPIHG